MEELKAIFAKFGEVKGLMPVEDRRHVVYIVRTLWTHAHTQAGKTPSVASRVSTLYLCTENEPGLHFMWPH